MSEAGAQRAVDFFVRAGLTRLLEGLRAKYIAEGQVRGQAVLEESSAAERREIASFLGRAPYRDATIRVRLADIDQALRKSGFACTLLDVLIAFRPDEPLETRQERRAAHAAHQFDFHHALRSLAEELPERGRFWLLNGLHGLEWLFARYKNAPSEEQVRQLAIISYVAGLLDQLPVTSERLALFAQRTSGDPHALDAGRPAGRLFLLALNDLSSAATATPPQERAYALRLYSEVGLLVDTISSSVAVYNLAGAFSRSGEADPFPHAAGARILLLPQRQLLEWSSAQAAHPDIYVFENPQVFEEVIDSLTRQDMPATPPTLVCTAGWPSVAALLLLDQLLASSEANTLHYSGDFDLKGLQIASHLLLRYPGRCQPWRFDPEAYDQALQSEGMPARENELALLSTLPGIFAPLVAVMQAKSKWAYQEGIAHLLAQDVVRDF